MRWNRRRGKVRSRGPVQKLDTDACGVSGGTITHGLLAKAVQSFPRRSCGTCRDSPYGNANDELTQKNSKYDCSDRSCADPKL